MKKNPKIIIIIITLIIFMVIICCICSASLYFFANSDKGVIEIESFSEGYKSIEQISDDISVKAILIIEPEIHNKNLYVTNERGLLRLKNVPVGEYSITPLYSNASYTKTVEVLKGKTAKVTVPSEFMSIHFIEFNTALSNPPFDNADVRKAISYLIDTDAYKNNALKVDFTTAASDFLPDKMDFKSSSKEIKHQQYNPDKAAAKIKNIKPFQFTLTISTTTSDGLESNYKNAGLFVQNSLKNDIITDIKLKIQPFEATIMLLDSKAYEAALTGWFLDSNNMLEFYKEFLSENSETSYKNEEIYKLIKNGDNALKKGDLEGYEDSIIEINNILVEQCPMIALNYSEEH